MIIIKPIGFHAILIVLLSSTEIKLENIDNETVSSLTLSETQTPVNT